MGFTISKLFFPEKEIHILVLGLQGAGKTTILQKLKMGDVVTTLPTIACMLCIEDAFDVGATFDYVFLGYLGVAKRFDYYMLSRFSIETVQYKNITFTAFDVGGQNQYRHFQNAQGIIFVVDSNDRNRISEAREELSRILNTNELSDSLLLVLANKQDLGEAMSAAEITDQLALQSLRGRSWYIQAACAASGDGLYEGMEWLSNVLKKRG
ncbi:hypothetical protein BGZ98_004904 [Dissophora globulifera]|nr:hypothetical protein BGZ98_004904 [Dissophora globulifera]